MMLFKSTAKIWFLPLIIFTMFSCASAPKAGLSVSYESDTVSMSRSETADNERMITYTASLTLSVKNSDEAREVREKLSENTKVYNGFIVRVTDNLITARIPADNMDNFLADARKLGKAVEERKTGIDITDQYRDNLIRLESLKNVRGRYLALLERAVNVSDILSIEKELERIITQIELLEGRIKYAELSAAYSNITVNFRERSKPGPVGWIFVGLYKGIKWLFVWN